MSWSGTDNPELVNASPEKRFFISMLVKDIELLPAIIDLVDNSVDAARSIRGSDRYDGLSVELTVKSDRFEIQDNCGGMEAELARNYAFRFGRPRDFIPIPSSVGQFGVGMKRALFKLGTLFTVASGATDSSFLMDVDVDKWAADDDPDWTFTFNNVDYEAGVPEEERFTLISVTRLHPHIVEAFGRPPTISRLCAQLALKHQSALQRGLTVKVNDIPVESSTPTLLRSDSIIPINRGFSVPANGEEHLNVRIVAGLSRSTRDDRRDDGIAQEFSEIGEAGWYVYCNDRLVLEADRSQATGWGSGAAAYHPQYRQFRGYVFLSSEDASLLPWNTTKTALDGDAPAFRYVRSEMVAVLREVQAVINRAKTEAAYIKDEDDIVTPLVQAIQTAEPLEITALAESARMIVPANTPQKPTPPTHINVQYRAPKYQVEKVIQVLDERSASRAGRATFDYFVACELEDM